MKKPLEKFEKGIFYFDNLYIERDNMNTPGKIWIGDRTGEGGEFDIKALEKVIQKFYKDNF